jgi:hypothetical protein
LDDGEVGDRSENWRFWWLKSSELQGSRTGGGKNSLDPGPLPTTTLKGNYKMETASASAEALKKQIAEMECQLEALKEQLTKVEASQLANGRPMEDKETEWPLLLEEYKRYGRQMILPSIGIQGMSAVPFSSQSEEDGRSKMCRTTPS